MREAGGKMRAPLHKSFVPGRFSQERKICPAGCGAVRVPVGPSRDFQIEDGWQGTEAGGQGVAAAGPLTTQTFNEEPPQLFAGARPTSTYAIGRPEP